MYNLFWIGVTLLLFFKTSHTNCESFELVHSVHRPELKEDCDFNKNENSVHKLIFDKVTCFMVWEHLKTHASEKCTEFWYNNKRYDNIGIKGPMQRAVNQYCNGTEYPEECFKCFNKTVDHIWFRNPCKTESRWANVSQCLRDYENNDFQWSRDLILNEKPKVVTIDRNSYPYKLCGNNLADLGNYTSFAIQFPLHIPRVREEEEREFDVFLSLFLNAFESNNPDGATVNAQGFRCEDFLKGGYLSRYFHAVVKPVTIHAEGKVVNAYRTVRNDMCNKTTNKDECASCYNEGDKKFFFYLKNNNTEIDSVLDNFTEVNAIYEKCHRENDVPEEYKKMLLGSHEGLDKIDSTCGDTFYNMFNRVKQSKSFCETSEQNKKGSYKDNFDVVLKVMSFNVFSHLGYGLKYQNGKECPLDAFEHLFCMIRIGLWISRRLEDELTANEVDDTINEFTSMLSEGCPDAFRKK